MLHIVIYIHLKKNNTLDKLFKLSFLSKTLISQNKLVSTYWNSTIQNRKKPKNVKVSELFESIKIKM